MSCTSCVVITEIDRLRLQEEPREHGVCLFTRNDKIPKSIRYFKPDPKWFNLSRKSSIPISHESRF